MPFLSPVGKLKMISISVLKRLEAVDIVFAFVKNTKSVENETKGYEIIQNRAMILLYLGGSKVFKKVG